MEDEAVSVYHDDRKSLDDTKIDEDIPPNFDKNVISDIELIKFAIEVDNVKRWYTSPEQWRQWPPGCVTKIAKNAFHKRALRYQYEGKTQTLYRIIKKKDTCENNLSLMPFNFLFNQLKMYYNRSSWQWKVLMKEIIDNRKFSVQPPLLLLSQIPWSSETSWGRCTVVLVPGTCPKH